MLRHRKRRFYCSGRAPCGATLAAYVDGKESSMPDKGPGSKGGAKKPKGGGKAAKAGKK